MTNGSVISGNVRITIWWEASMVVVARVAEDVLQAGPAGMDAWCYGMRCRNEEGMVAGKEDLFEVWFSNGARSVAGLLQLPKM